MNLENEVQRVQCGYLIAIAIADVRKVWFEWEVGACYNVIWIPMIRSHTS